MAYRYQTIQDRHRAVEPRFLEMVIMPQKQGGKSRVQLVMLDGDRDTVQLVQDNMNEIVANVIKV